MSQAQVSLSGMSQIDMIDVICNFCNSAENDEMRLGLKYTYKQYQVHYFCLLLSAGAYQTGDENQGILGFVPTTINKVLKKAKRRRCHYCKMPGASLVCCEKACRTIFHLPCGIKGKCIMHYYDQFETYCDKHAPMQIFTEEDRLYSLTNSRHESVCGICYENLVPEVNYNILWAPCCRNGFFHRDCVLKLAHSAGHAHFKCPLCNNKNGFIDEMQRMGIYIPQKDAAWELEPDAYHDLYMRYNRCDAHPCLCPFNRNHSGKCDTDWMLMLCQFCGSSGMHKACLQKVDYTKQKDKYCCEFCFNANKHMLEGGANSSINNISQNHSFKLIKRLRPNITADDGASQVKKLKTDTNVKASNSHDSQSDSDSDVDIVQNSDDEIPPTKDSHNKSNIAFNPIGNSKGSAYNLPFRVPINSDTEESQEQGSPQIYVVSAQVHNAQQLTLPKMIEVEDKLKKYEEVSNLPAPGVETSTNLLTLNSSSRSLKLSHNNSPQCKTSYKKNGLNPFAIEIYRKKAVEVSEKSYDKGIYMQQVTTTKSIHTERTNSSKVHMNNPIVLKPNSNSTKFSRQALEFEVLERNLHTSDKGISITENEDHMVQSSYSRAHTENPENKTEGRETVLDKNLVDIIGQLPTNRIRTQFSTGLWLRQRNIAMNSKHVYQDISKKNAKRKYETPIWKQKMVEIRERANLDSHHNGLIPVDMTKNINTRTENNIVKQPDIIEKLSATESEPWQQKETELDCTYKNSRVQRNDTKNVQLDTNSIITPINLNTNYISKLASKYSMNSKAYKDKIIESNLNDNLAQESNQITKKSSITKNHLNNNSPIPGPSNRPDRTCEPKLDRVPAYIKVIQKRNAQIGNKIKESLNTSIVDNSLEINFENTNIMHSTQNEVVPIPNDIDISTWNEYENSPKDPNSSDIEINKFKAFIDKLKSRPKAPTNNKHEVNKNNHDQCLEKFRIAKRNVIASKEKYLIAKNELLKSQLNYEIAEKELYKEIYKLKLEELKQQTK